jgi:hypothetical protein
MNFFKKIIQAEWLPLSSSFVYSSSILLSVFFISILVSCNNPLGSNSNAPSSFLPGSGSANLGLTDNTSTLFNKGSSTGSAVVWDSTNNFVRLSQAGVPTNNSELDSTWTPQWSNLLGYWKLNESVGAASVADSSGKGNTGAVQSGATLGVSGHLNTAASFNGSSNGYIDVPTTTALAMISSPTITISAWVSTSNWNGTGVIVRKRVAANVGYQIYIQGGAFNFHFGTLATGVSLPALASNTWHHFVVTADGANHNWYLDGVLIGSAATTTAAGDSSALDLSFGGVVSAQGGGQDFSGSIDDVAIWSTALTSTQIQTIYNRQSAKYAGTFQSRVMDGLSSISWLNFTWTSTLPFFKELPDYASSAVQNESSSSYSSQSASLMNGIGGLWHLDEALGTTGSGSILDRSGNSKNGTPNGSMVFGATGKLGNAAQFDGSSTYISAPTISAARTISAWVNPAIQGQMPIADVATSSVNNHAFNFGIYSPGSPGGSNNAFNSTYGIYVVFWGNDVAIPYDAIKSGWHHVVVSWDGGTGLTVGIDGIFPSGYAMNAANVWSSSQSQPLALVNGVPTPNYSTTLIGSVTGRYWNLGLSYFQGTIDEVAIWNRLLSTTEIVELYRRGANRIKYQVRSCSDSTCGTNPTWLGPDNTNQTYFNELNNNAIQSTAGDLSMSNTVLPGLPVMTFSNFGSLLIPANRYFQYRAIMESDDPCSGAACGCNYGSGATWCSPELQSAIVSP